MTTDNRNDTPGTSGTDSSPHASARQAAEAATEAAIVVDQAGRILAVNGLAEKLFGYTRQELDGKTIESLVPDRLKEPHLNHRRTYRRDPYVRPMGESLELRAVAKDGREFRVKISLQPLRTEEGLLVVSLVREISDGNKS